MVGFKIRLVWIFGGNMGIPLRELGCIAVSLILGSLPCRLLAGSSEGTPAAFVLLTPDKAVELALSQSLDLQKSFIELSTAGYAASHLWSEIFPEISVGGGLNYGSALFSGDGFRVERGALRTSASLGVTLRFNAALPAVMKSISLAYHAQLLSYENARRQLEFQVFRTFYGLIAEIQNLFYLEEVVQHAERLFEKNRIAFENGFLGQLVYLQSQLSAETAKLNLSRASTAYNSRLGEFLVLLGYGQDQEADLEGVIAISRVEVDPEQLIRDYLPRRPDIVSRRQTIEQRELTERRSLLTGRVPSLNLSAQWGGNWSPNFSDTLSGSISFGLPIESWIPGTGGNQEVRAARAETEKARLELRIAENQAMTEIRSLAENLRSSWESIEIARLRVEIARRTYELTEEGFQNGTVEFLALEETRNRMAEARQQLLSDELTYKTMTLDMAAALNIEVDELTRSVE
jgi:outer membrane protein TolC